MGKDRLNDVGTTGKLFSKKDKIRSTFDIICQNKFQIDQRLKCNKQNLITTTRKYG